MCVYNFIDKKLFFYLIMIPFNTHTNAHAHAYARAIHCLYYVLNGIYNQIK